MGVTANNFQYAKDDKAYIDGQIDQHNISREAHLDIREVLTNLLKELEGKVDKEAGKGLSTFDYNTVELGRVTETFNLAYENKADIKDLEKLLSEKVDKIAGKGLSTNDFTNELLVNLKTAHDASQTNKKTIDGHMKDRVGHMSAEERQHWEVSMMSIDDVIADAEAAVKVANTAANVAQETATQVKAQTEFVLSAAEEANKIGNLTVSSETLSPGSEATVVKTDDGKAVSLTFGIPKGDKLIYAELTEEEKKDLAGYSDLNTEEAIETVADEAANAVKGRAEGKNIQLSGVSPVAHKVKAAVKEGKNLLGYRSFTKTGLGLTVSYDADTQIFTINGTTTGTGTINLTEYMVEKPDIGAGQYSMVSTYYVGGTTSKGNAYNHFHLGQNDTEDAAGTTNYASVILVDPASSSGKSYASYYTPIEKRYVAKTWFFLYDTEAVTYTDYQIKIQLERGWSSTAFVPYYNPKEVSVYGCGRNILGFSDSFSVSRNGLTLSYDAGTQIFTMNGTPTAGGTSIAVASSYIARKPYLGTGQAITFSLEHLGGTLSAEDANDFFIIKEADTADGAATNGAYIAFPLSGKLYQSRTMTKKYIVQCAIYISRVDVTFTDYQFRIQLELGDEATDFEAFSMADGVNQDGVAAVPSFSPDMTLLSETPEVSLEVSYNRDTNKVIEELTNAIIALGGSVPAAAAEEGEG